MVFKLFPVTITSDGRKVPLIKEWATAATMDQDQLELWRQVFQGRLHYWGIPTGHTTGLLVLDVDVKHDGFSRLAQVQVPPTMTQRTRSGGAHFLFNYPNDGKHYGNRVGLLKQRPDEKTGVDVRGEGGFIVYYGTDQTPLADPPPWILQDSLRTVVTSGISNMVVAPEIAQEMILTYLDRIRECGEGERNNTLNKEAFAIGQLVASHSISREYAESVLYLAAKECGIEGYEAKATITSGLDGGSKKPMMSPFSEPIPLISIPPPPMSTRWTPGLFTKYDLMNTSKLKKPQLFKDWSTEDIHITTADGGTGKTTLKLFEAVCLALGEPFLGFECKQKGRTLFITGEDTEKKIGAMLGQIVRQMGLFNDDAVNHAKIDTIIHSVLVKKDSDLCLVTKDRNGFLYPSAEAMLKVVQALEDTGPFKMIVFDPISMFWGPESAVNDMNKAVAKYMGELQERSEACIEMINHMGKQSSANKDMTQFAGRGGTGLPSHARVSRVFRQVPEEEYIDLTGEQLAENQSAMMVNVNKFTDGSPLFNKPFLILREGYLFSRKVLTPAKEKEIEKTQADTDRIFEFIRAERKANKYPTKPIIIGYFMSTSDPISKARVERAINMLQYQGWMGEKIRQIENPDLSVKDKAFIITDLDGKET